MKRLIFLLPALIISCQLFPQNFLSPGFVVTNENDTVRGMIKYFGDHRNSEECHIIPNGSFDLSIYNPSDLKEYHISGEKYYLPKDVISQGISKRLFVVFLVEGKANLYTFTDRAGIHYLIEKDGVMSVLPGVNSSESRSLESVLTKLLSDCNEIGTIVKKAKLKDESLRNTMKRYNECVAPGEMVISYNEVPRQEFRIRYGPRIGYNFAYLEFSGYHHYLTFESEQYPSAGFVAVADLPLRKHKISVVVQADFGKMEFFAEDIQETAVRYASEKVYIESSYLWGIGAVRYTLPVRRIAPSIGFGMGYQLNINSDHQRVLDINILGNETHYEYDDVPYPTGFIILHGHLTLEYLINQRNAAFLDLTFNMRIGEIDNVASFIPTMQIGAGFYF